ncbi:MAG: 2-succinyl-5-enolpyruvyl-6-hydroxy-3-cyclohexene-1-carboxylic-acid synthase [Flavobacteriaceae bacterium]|nr:2-succinyl-5-enolpyruvyl-6-hydroxy-3-cyclohexene-1-carboxylic-acid synthase [Flavobacteriaceae bacterium]
MIYPKKELAQLIIYACQENGIEKVVISPGSRNAALSIGFFNNKKINCLSIVDERCAAFFALGIAQQTKKPVALVCTSGSALLNYYPAIAEAYYSNIPLVILSADRPKHLLKIGDGQTIKQYAVFANHILKSVQLIEEVDALNHNFKTVNTTLQLAILESGPVHINIPFNEPLYEITNKPTSFPKISKIAIPTLLEEKPLDINTLEKFATIWNNSKKKMVLIGTYFPSELIQTQINHLVKDSSVLVLTETTSNIYHKKTINAIDKLIVPLTEKELETLQPEVLLTFGGMIVSKKIKQFLRKYQPKQHWHIDKKNKLDTFHCLTKYFKISAALFFSQFFFLTKDNKSDYQQKWLSIKEKREQSHHKFLLETGFSDLKVFGIILKSLPKDSLLQLANSSIIRYSQLFNLKNTLQVFCNRGTSGIDGSTSTAIGASFATNRQTIFITGDISFFYDSNALWNNYIPTNFRIILINNSGGGIFRFIPGPKTTNVLPLFETPHNLNASHLCSMYGFEYLSTKNTTDLTKKLTSFYSKSNQPKLIEIFTPKNLNDLILTKYFFSFRN